MTNSLFDVAGPIMVGPSSSHTAGACKIGQFARAVFRGTPTKVTVYLHGSFGTVYMGHATDRAILAGIMKMHAKDMRLPDAFAIAKEKKLKYEFIPTDLGPEYHPNTAKIILEKPGFSQSLTGSSIGGGKVIITHINDIPVDFEAAVGRFHSLLIGHDSRLEVLHPVYGKIIEWGHPVVSKQTRSMGKNSLTFLNLEHDNLTLPEVLELEQLPGIQFVRALGKLLKH